MQTSRLPILTLVVTLLTVFVLTTAISVHAVETALTRRLQHSDKEVAHAMAIGLSRPNVSMGDAQSLIDAHFAMGNYQRIRLLDNSGTTIYARERLERQGVQASLADSRLFWIWKLKPQEQLTPASAAVKSNPLGISHVSVQSILTFDHESSERWLLQFAAIIACLTTAAAALLHWIGRQRKKAIAATESALSRLMRAEPIRLPDPPDSAFSGTFTAINQLSEQIGQRMHKAMEQVEQLNRLRRTDPATGLLNREAFLTRLGQAAATQRLDQPSLITIVRIMNLQTLNARQGRQHVDALLSDMGRRLAELTELRQGIAVGRISGTDIALLLGPDDDDATRINQELLSVLSHCGLRTRLDEIAFSRDERPEDILTRCELNQAARGPAPQDDRDQRDQWYERLTWALTQHHFYLQGFRSVDAGGSVYHREYYLRLAEKKTGLLHVGATLMAWAEHLGLAAEIDQEVANLALSEAADRTERVCINLTASVLSDPRRLEALLFDLSQTPRHVSRIDIDINEAAAFAHIDRLVSFIESVRDMGVRVGIDRLDEHAGDLARLHGCGISYVKLAATLTDGLLDAATGRERARLLADLVSSARTLSIDTLAENIRQPAMVQALFELGFSAVSGPAVGE